MNVSLPAARRRAVSRLLSVLLFIVCDTAAFAQDTLAQLQSELVSPWIVTVEGEARLRVLRISGVAQKTPETFILDAAYGWIDGSHAQVRAELSHVAGARRVQIVTPAASVIAATQTADGSFTGTFAPGKGAPKVVRLEKLSEQEITLKTKAALAARGAQTFANEDKDWGIEATSRPRTSQYHAPTPVTVPGGRTIKTMELSSLLSTDKAVVVVDVLDSQERTTIPGAYWMAGAGSGQLFGADKERFAGALKRLTDADAERPIVFTCSGSDCWLSYNASLHAIAAGYRNVIWFRGGTDAWSAAGLPRRKPERINW